MLGKGSGRSQYGMKSPRIEMLQSVEQENTEEEAEATVEDDTEMEAEEDEDNLVVQEATIMGGMENKVSSTDKSEESDDDSDYS
jgi:hypothetical protein